MVYFPAPENTTFPGVSHIKMVLLLTGELDYTKSMNTNKRLNRRQSSIAIDNMETFVNSTGSLKGYRRSDDCQPCDHMTGMLNATERQRFLSDGKHGIEYLVVSYDTPIAWVCVDGSRYRVEQKFSTTTSCHMGLTWRSDSAKVEA